MILTIDIGNTNTNFGLFNGSKLVKKFFVPTGDISSATVKRRIGSSAIEAVVICSVVPQATKRLSRALSRFSIKKPLIIGKDVLVPVRNRYRKPRQVGQDRLVNAYAGIRLYGVPAVIVDFGTAVTFDVVSGRKEYLGGMILPGLRISLASLAHNTALLPEIKLTTPREFIGRDTRSSILSGVVHGFSALTDRLVERIRRELGKRTKVIGTGGDARLLSRYCRSFSAIDPDLTLKGLQLIYEVNRVIASETR